MEKRPLISFCIPTYKRPEEVKNAVESIVFQKDFDAKNMEVLVFDDAPDSPAYKSIAPLLQRYPSIQYHLNTPNKGIDANILALAKAAKGKFILFLTDDDTFRPGSLKVLMNTLRKHPRIHFWACAYQIVLNGKATRVHRVFPQDRMGSSLQTAHCAALFKDTETLSGKCLAKDALQLSTHRQYTESLYCHLVLAGNALLSGSSYYCSQPLIHHVIGNEVFWKYSGDYMLSDLNTLIEKVGKRNEGFIREAKKQLFSSLPYIAYINIFSPQKLLPVAQTILQKGLYKLPEFWVGLVIGTFSTIKTKLSL